MDDAPSSSNFDPVDHHVGNGAKYPARLESASHAARSEAACC